MAMQAGDGLPWYAKFIVMLLILLVGHAINIGLCLIGAFVHPMRLTFVEFYKNAGFEGGGKEYNPFRNSEIK
jgi:V/A-type H+-transporting ATPase subunit I